MSYIGKNIKKLRSVKGLSQAKFAEIFDIKRASIGAYEEGRAEPKTDTIIKIANYFNLTLDDLLVRELTVNQLSGFDPNQESSTNNISKPTISTNLISKSKLKVDLSNTEATIKRDIQNQGILQELIAAILTQSETEYEKIVNSLKQNHVDFNKLQEPLDLCRKYAGLSIEKEILKVQKMLS